MRTRVMDRTGYKSLAASGCALAIGALFGMGTGDPLYPAAALVAGLGVFAIVHTVNKQQLSRLSAPRSERDPVLWASSRLQELENEKLHLVSRIKALRQSQKNSFDRLQALFSSMTLHQEESMERVGESVAAVHSMEEAIRNIARNTETCAQTAHETKDSAAREVDTVLRMVGKMNEVMHVVDQASESITRLGDSSQKIGQIMSVINDIADQTNLLALNAAIEAARAGEHGRGFAVVADEVRKLAEKTTGATREVSETIQEIQELTGKSRQVMSEGMKGVGSGVEIVTETGETLADIVNKMETVASMIDEIAGGAERQAAATSQLDETLKEMARSHRKAAVEVELGAQALGEVDESELPEAVPGILALTAH